MSNTRDDQNPSNQSSSSFLTDTLPATATSAVTYVAAGGVKNVLQLKEPITQAALNILNTASTYIQSMKVEDLITFIKAPDSTTIGPTDITKGQFLKIYNTICENNNLPNYLHTLLEKGKDHLNGYWTGGVTAKCFQDSLTLFKDQVLAITDTAKDLVQPIVDYVSKIPTVKTGITALEIMPKAYSAIAAGLSFFGGRWLHQWWHNGITNNSIFAPLVCGIASAYTAISAERRVAQAILFLLPGQNPLIALQQGAVGLAIPVLSMVIQAGIRELDSRLLAKPAIEGPASSNRPNQS